MASSGSSVAANEEFSQMEMTLLYRDDNNLSWVLEEIDRLQAEVLEL